MAVVTMVSAKGSPGVTTTVVGLALAWSGANPGRQAIAVDADPIGGDTAAGILRGAVTAAVGMLPLATARGVSAWEAVAAAAVDLRGDGRARLIPGVPDRARSGALPLGWDLLNEVRAEQHAEGTDLLVDAGRADRADAGAPWLGQCDLGVLCVRPTLAAVTAAHRFAMAWPRGGAPLEVLVVQAPSPYRAEEVAGAIGLPLIATVPFDVAAARVHSEGAPPPRGFERSAYARGLRRAAGDLGATAVARAGISVAPSPTAMGGDLDGTF